MMEMGKKRSDEAKLFYKTASIFSLFLAYKFDCALIEKVLINNSRKAKKNTERESSAADVTGLMLSQTGCSNRKTLSV